MNLATNRVVNDVSQYADKNKERIEKLETCVVRLTHVDLNPLKS